MSQDTLRARGDDLIHELALLDEVTNVERGMSNGAVWFDTEHDGLRSDVSEVLAHAGAYVDKASDSLDVDWIAVI